MYFSEKHTSSYFTYLPLKQLLTIINKQVTGLNCHQGFQRQLWTPPESEYEFIPDFSVLDIKSTAAVLQTKLEV